MSILDKAVIVQDEIIPDGIPLMELADRVVRGKIRLSPPQQRMLIEMLPYIAPKLSATAIATMDGKTFAEALDRAIERSKGPVLLNSPKTVEHEELVRAEEMKAPFTRHYRRFVK
jgi:hypothetical protein